MKCGPTVKSVINKRNSIAEERIIDPITFYYYVGPTPFFTNFSLFTLSLCFPVKLNNTNEFFIMIASIYSKHNQRNLISFVIEVHYN